MIAVASPGTQTLPVPAGSLLLLGRPVDAATFGLDVAADPNIGDRSLSPGVTDGFGEVDATASPSLKKFVRKRGSQTGPTTGLVVGLLRLAGRGDARQLRHGAGPGTVATSSEPMEFFVGVPGSVGNGITGAVRFVVRTARGVRLSTWASCRR